jgi:hypothetical protein
MMLADSDERPRGLFNPYPTYHVRDIRLLERP